MTIFSLVLLIIVIMLLLMLLMSMMEREMGKGKGKKRRHVLCVSMEALLDLPLSLLKSLFHFFF